MIPVLSPAAQKINSFLENGFLSGDKLKQLIEIEGQKDSIATSYDDKLRTQVSLNCISAREGIQISLYSPAKGGFVVMIEERLGQQGILDRALQRNEAAIASKEKELSMYGSYARPTARKNVLCNDELFLADITEKVHKTALFVLQNLEVAPGENQASDGCKETGRREVLGDKISCVLLPKRYEQEFANLRVKSIFVDSAVAPCKFIFCYEDETDTAQQIVIARELMIPNYFEELRKLSLQRDLIESPLYTHMTRLP